VEAEHDTVNLAEAWLTAEESRDTLKREPDYTASVLQTAGSLVMVCDRHGKVVRFNQACELVSGYAFEEVKGRNFWDRLVPRDQLDASRAAFLSRGPADFPHVSERPWQGRDGRRRQVRWTATALLSGDGELDYIVYTGTDVTERAALERLKDEFLGVVSHELRTPLTSIRGALGLLSGGMLGEVSPKGQRMLEIASLSADRLARLVNDLLDVERLESGHLALDYQACDAIALMEQAVATVQGMAAESNVTVEVDPLEAPLVADPDRVIQVLTNLLGNAVKFSPPGGRVWLRAERLPEGLLFEVRDQGRGIPDDKLELVFDRFQQVDASDSREKGGTGLGLAICRGLVAQHGGRIWAENGLERGAVFRFVLPGAGVGRVPAVVDSQAAPCPPSAS
ncbi:MAG: hypothetical protein JWM80_2192, partial [Cyanobacteria bacterium RYN_339]|nr:hypothetical protein [Cyanobacteria bacterium RYN_339]